MKFGERRQGASFCRQQCLGDSLLILLRCALCLLNGLLVGRLGLVLGSLNHVVERCDKWGTTLNGQCLKKTIKLRWFCWRGLRLGLRLGSLRFGL